MGEREHYNCSTCGQSFDSRDDMERHRRSSHQNMGARASRGYHCSRCGIDFESHDQLQAHTRDVHQNM